MTIAGTDYGYWACTACGDMQWCEGSTGLCYECRKDNMSIALVKDGQFEESIRPHSEALAEFLSDDAREYALATQADLDEAGAIINELRDRAKSLEALEKSATRPILAGAEVIRAWFRPARKAADEARALWDNKIKVYVARQAQAQREVERKLEASIAAGDQAAATAELAKLEAAPVAAGVAVVSILDWELLNIELVPSEYLMLNDDAIKLVAKGAKELPVVPGIRFFWKQSVRAVGR